MKWYALLSWLPALLMLLMARQAEGVWDADGSDPIARDDRISHYRQMWKPLTAVFTEEQGYGMYTYVLFGRPARSAGGVEKLTVERYEHLLEAINLLTSATAGDDSVDQTASHVFLIPLMSAGKDPTPQSYNTDVSKRYLSFSSGMFEATAPSLSRRLTAGEGPFLITVPKPLKDAEKQGAGYG